MCGRLMLAGVLVLVGVSEVRSDTDEMSAEERDRLKAEATKLEEEGYELYGQGKIVAAAQRQEQALALHRKLYTPRDFPDGHARLAASLYNMGFLLRALGRLESALEHYQQSLAMRQKLYPEKQFP